MKKVQCYIDNQSYKEKPSAQDIPIISNRIIKQEQQVTMKQLAEELCIGKTLLPALMKGTRKDNHMVKQEILCLDFDKGDTTIADIQQDSFIQQYASFIYTTFNHTEEQTKFRIVFLLDEALYREKDVTSMYEYLFHRFPSIDRSCMHPSRLFFGGRHYIEINFNNVLPVVSFMPIYKDTLIGRTRSVNPNKSVSDLHTWELMKLGNKSEVQERLSAYSYCLPSKSQAVEYIKQCDMRKLLDLPSANTFYDLFHEEDNPSASVFLSDEGNVHMYHCFSFNASFTGDIFKVVGKLTGLGYFGAQQYLIDVMAIEIYKSEEVQRIEDTITATVQILKDRNIKHNFPQFHSIAHWYLDEMALILQELQHNMIEDEQGNIIPLSMLSVRTFAYRIYPHKKNPEAHASRVSDILSLMTYIEFIDKMDYKELPAFVQQELTAIQRERGQYRKMNVFKLLELKPYFFDALDDWCGMMKSQGFTLGSLSYDYVLVTHGQERADRVFPQQAGKSMTDFTLQLQKDVIQHIQRDIQKKGYAVEKDVFKRVQQKYKRKQVHVPESKLNQLRGGISGDYGLHRVRLNKELREQLQVSMDSRKKPIIYCK